MNASLRRDRDENGSQQQQEAADGNQGVDDDDCLGGELSPRMKRRQEKTAERGNNQDNQCGQQQ